MQPNDNRQLSIPRALTWVTSNVNAFPSTNHLSSSPTVTVPQTPGSSFTLTDNPQSTNADTIASSYTSLDPSPREPQDPYDDPYDDPEFDQIFESLNGPNSTDKSGTSPPLVDSDEFALKQSDQDALAKFLEEET
ncbi:hypothetical protein FNAPI_2092 [Fusarium napiforme]|uniref:Uncharacterized protein n=1 Tax=Fusarium napiforme TaxID=42672 RepID=A0A8H5K2Q3_9HYPO|nr:hypothetical protein FNAPI_2092 [Fusarium napiforme]